MWFLSCLLIIILFNVLLDHTFFTHVQCVFIMYAIIYFLFVLSSLQKSAQMEENEGDTSLPNESWTPESFELYKKLTNDLMEQGNGDWVKHRTSLYNGERRLFTKAVISELPGKFFEYQFFYNQKEQRLKGLVQFGLYTQGPPG